MARYVAAAFIAAYFLAMSWPGLKSGFSHDDLMNLTFTLRDGWAKILTANVLFFSSTYRPLGALFYRGLFDIFGWNGLPFRIVQFAALSLNLYLLCRLTAKLTGWKEAGLIAALLIAWHGNFSPLFFGSGNCYDVLGFLFYLSALNYYVSIRERGIPGFRQLGILAILHICGLNSKEFAVTLPLVLLCYEVLRHPASFSRPAAWPFGEGRAALLSGLLSAAYTAGKMFGPDSLTAQSAYKLQFSAVAYLESVRGYLNDVSYRTDVSTQTAVWYLAILIAIPILLRSRPMAFGAAIALLAALPVLLIQPRGLASHYITMSGLALWIAAGLTDLRLRFTRAINASAFERGYAEVAVFSLTAAFLLWVHVPKRQFQIDYWQKDLLPIHQAAESFRKHPEWWSDPKTKILIVSDPFKDMHWAPIFIGILTARNMDLQIHRLPDMNPKPDEAILRTFPVALQWQENQFVRVDSAAVPVLR